MGSSDRRGETNHYSTRHYLPAHFMVTRSTHVVRVACLVAHSYFHLSTPLRQLNCAVNAAGTVNKVAVLSDDRNHSKSAREHKRPIGGCQRGHDLHVRKPIDTWRLLSRQQRLEF